VISSSTYVMLNRELGVDLQRFAVCLIDRFAEFLEGELELRFGFGKTGRFVVDGIFAMDTDLEE